MALGDAKGVALPKDDILVDLKMVLAQRINGRVLVFWAIEGASIGSSPHPGLPRCVVNCAVWFAIGRDYPPRPAWVHQIRSVASATSIRRSIRRRWRRRREQRLARRG